MRAWILGLLLLLGTAMASDAALRPAYPDTPVSGHVVFTQGVDVPGTTVKTIYTHADKASICVSLTATNGDSADHQLRVRIKSGGVSYPQTTIGIPTASGITAGTPPVQLLGGTGWPVPTESDGNQWIFLLADEELELLILGAWGGAAGETVTATVFCKNF